jgi:hypothetical protein
VGQLSLQVAVVCSMSDPRAPQQAFSALVGSRQQQEQEQNQQRQHARNGPFAFVCMWHPCGTHVAPMVCAGLDLQRDLSSHHSAAASASAVGVDGSTAASEAWPWLQWQPHFILATVMRNSSDVLVVASPMQHTLGSSGTACHSLS